LQAADILAYQAQFVPVGQDQVAHVELTREVARRFNSLYRSEVFPEPEALLTPSPKLPGIDGRKMSKSYGNTIGLSESPRAVMDKIQSMSTGGQRIRQTDPGDPDLCPVGELHKVFSAPDVIFETQKGCRSASIRCEFCKIEAGYSVCRVTEPIHVERARLDLQVPEVWDRLCSDSLNKAAKRAEETMISVREVFDLSHHLGFARQPSLSSPEEQDKIRDLSAYVDWWDLPMDQRSKALREYWRDKLVPYDIPLSQESNRVFSTMERELEEPYLTAKKKRVFVSTSRDVKQEGKWEFEIPARSYEVWTLLCWRNSDRRLRDFVFPQKVFLSDFSLARKSTKKEEKIPVSLLRTEGNHFFLSIAGRTGRDVTIFERDYEPLR
jgi:tryptophanyl-tRNA synthetase